MVLADSPQLPRGRQQDLAWHLVAVSWKFFLWTTQSVKFRVAEVGGSLVVSKKEVIANRQGSAPGQNVNCAV